MQHRPTSYLILLTVMWGALSFHWTVLGNNVVPTRVLEFSTAATKGRALGVVTVAGALVAMLTGPVAGILSDESRLRWGRRRPLLIAGVVINCAALLAVVGARSFGTSLLAMLGVQFGAHVASSPYVALIPDQVPDLQKGRATGFAGFSEVLGRLAGAIVGGLMVSLPAAAAAMAPYLPFLPPHVRRHPMLPLIAVTIGVLLAAAALTAAVVQEELRPARQPAPRLPLLRRAFAFDVRAERSFAWLLAARGMNSLAINTVTTFLLYYIHDFLGVEDIAEANAKLGYLFAVSAVTTLPSSLAAGYWIDRTQRRKIWVYASNAGLAAVALAFLAVERFPGALLAGAFFGLCYGAYFTSDWALGLALLPREGTAAKYLGIWNIAGLLPQVIAPGIGGLLLDSFNALRPNLGYSVVFLTVVLYLLVGIAMLARVAERHGPRAAKREPG